MRCSGGGYYRSDLLPKEGRKPRGWEYGGRSMERGIMSDERRTRRMAHPSGTVSIPPSDPQVEGRRGEVAEVRGSASGQSPVTIPLPMHPSLRATVTDSVKQKSRPLRVGRGGVILALRHDSAAVMLLAQNLTLNTTEWSN